MQNQGESAVERQGRIAQRPAHSDFIIHWTGKDIDSEVGRQGKAVTYADRCKIERRITKKYMERLRSILKFGLWMTEQQPGGETPPELAVDSFAMTSFTELRLSEVRAHADKYGRLGIGFKRGFLWERGGLPVWYYPPWAPNCRKALGDMIPPWPKRGRCFLKPMGPRQRRGYLCYEFYNESEWRIVHHRDLEKTGLARKPECVDGFDDYLAGLRQTASEGEPKRPSFLLPIKSRWFALVIYPNIRVRYRAQEDQEIGRLLRAAKGDGGLKKPPEGGDTASYERFVDPIELHLGNCTNF